MTRLTEGQAPVSSLTDCGCAFPPEAPLQERWETALLLQAELFLALPESDIAAWLRHKQATHN